MGIEVPTRRRAAEGHVSTDALAGLALLPAAAVLDATRSRDSGLSTEEAEARRHEVGPNRLPAARGPGLARQLLDQLIHFFALMLWAAAGLAFVGGMAPLGWAIIAVIVVNGLFSFAQEYRAERATRALAALLPERATVLRDGHRTTVPAVDLVPGDVVLLAEGDRISADARLIRSEGLNVDNSALTGESEPVPRTADPTESPQADPADAPNLVFAGSFVTSGSARGVVLATGAATRLGGITRLTTGVARRATPLRVSLTRTVRLIAALAVASGLAFFGVSLALGTPVRDGFLFAVGVIVALVPEGLLPTLTLSLSMSAGRMAERGALVRRLESVETLGSTTVICSDKTGTMTANQMTARAVAANGRQLEVTGSGYDPRGTILSGGRPLPAQELEELGDLLRAAALCGDARVEQHGGRWRCVGDPTEGALLVLADKGGVTRQEAERRTPRAREFPFESSRRRMSTVHALASGEVEIFAKGSPESVLPICATVREPGGGTSPLDHDGEIRVIAAVERLAGQGLRVLALARAVIPGLPGSAGDAERDLELLGLVGMADPVRPEVPAAVARCRHAGIRVVMITGDHPATAASVARAAGLDAQRVLIGAELPSDPAGLRTLLADRAVGVLARVLPEQKLRVAEALQAGGEVVAMTGDGVNDAPALRRADIGVAMGVSGTDVAREAADMVLLDDSFAHIVEAVEEGRAAFDNIRRFLTYHLTDNVAELAPFVLWALSAGRIPLMLSVLQVLALDIGTDLLPALALGAEGPARGTMDRPPRPRTERLLDRLTLLRAFGFLGPVEAAVSLAMLPLGAWLFFGWGAGHGLPRGGPAKATLSTMVFASIVTMQMANAFACRSRRLSLATIGPFSNRLLVGAVAVEAFVLATFVYAGPIRSALGQNALTPLQWVPVVVAPWILLGVEELRKWAVRRLPGEPLGAPPPPRPHAGTAPGRARQMFPDS